MERKKRGEFFFFAERLKTKSSDDTIRRTVRLIERYCIFTAYFLVVFWLFLVVFDNDEDNKFELKEIVNNVLPKEIVAFLNTDVALFIFG